MPSLKESEYLSIDLIVFSKENFDDESIEEKRILPSTNAVNTSFLQAWRKHLHGKLMMQRRAVKLQNSDHTMDEIFLLGGLRNASDAISASGRVEVWSVPNLEGTPAYGTASKNP